jgi:hypothetical protein
MGYTYKRKEEISYCRNGEPLDESILNRPLLEIAQNSDTLLDLLKFSVFGLVREVLRSFTSDNVAVLDLPSSLELEARGGVLKVKSFDNFKIMYNGVVYQVEVDATSSCSLSGGKKYLIVRITGLSGGEFVLDSVTLEDFLNKGSFYPVLSGKAFLYISDTNVTGGAQDYAEFVVGELEYVNGVNWYYTQPVGSQRPVYWYRKEISDIGFLDKTFQSFWNNFETSLFNRIDYFIAAYKFFFSRYFTAGVLPDENGKPLLNFSIVGRDIITNTDIFAILPNGLPVYVSKNSVVLSNVSGNVSIYLDVDSSLRPYFTTVKTPTSLYLANYNGSIFDYKAPLIKMRVPTSLVFEGKHDKEGSVENGELRYDARAGLFGYAVSSDPGSFNVINTLNQVIAGLLVFSAYSVPPHSGASPLLTGGGAQKVYLSGTNYIRRVDIVVDSGAGGKVNVTENIDFQITDGYVSVEYSYSVPEETGYLIVKFTPTGVGGVREKKIELGSFSNIYEIVATLYISLTYSGGVF